MKHYIILQVSYKVDQNGEMLTDTHNIDKQHYYGTTSEGIEVKMQEIADSIKDVEQGTAVEIIAYEATENDFYEYDYEEGDDIIEYLELGDPVVDSIMIDAEYNNIEGAIICEWRFEQYTGYVRSCRGIEVASWRDDERILIPKDEPFKYQYSVIAYAHELTGDENTDKETVLKNIISMGKWRNPGFIVEQLNLMFPDTEELKTLPL